MFAPVDEVALGLVEVRGQEDVGPEGVEEVVEGRRLSGEDGWEGTACWGREGRLDWVSLSFLSFSFFWGGGKEPFLRDGVVVMVRVAVCCGCSARRW